ncbi:hypothetical protein VTO42DRAFT_5208 [Malbranchea cinnamomea]
MEGIPRTIDELAKLIEITPSSSKLLEKFMEVEGDISLQFGDTHLTSDTEFLTTYFSAYIFVLLLEDQINEARMLTHRMPSSLFKAHPVMESTLTMLRAVWNDKYSLVYQTIRQTKWPPAVAKLAQSYETYFQNKAFDLLGLAYEAIRPSSVAYFLGIDSMTDDPAPEIISTFTAKGWEWDAQSKLFRPKPNTTVSTQKEMERLKIGELASLIGSYRNQGV